MFAYELLVIDVNMDTHFNLTFSGRAAHLLYARLLGDDQDAIHMQDILAKWKSVFGDQLSQEAAQDILHECCADTGAGETSPRLLDKDSYAISEEQLDAWWRSPKALAQKYRQIRQEDTKNVKWTVAYFNIHHHPGTPEEKLWNAELGKMMSAIKYLSKSEKHLEDATVSELRSEMSALQHDMVRYKLRQALDQRWPLSKHHIQRSTSYNSVEVSAAMKRIGVSLSEEELGQFVKNAGTNSLEDGPVSYDEILTHLYSKTLPEYELQLTKKVLKSMHGYLPSGFISFPDFYLWLQSETVMADKVRSLLELYRKEMELRQKETFPWVPLISPACRSMISKPSFDSTILSCILINTAIVRARARPICP